MTVHNSVLLAAAISGITAGAYDGEDFSQVTAGSSAAAPSVTLRSAILVAANAVDQAIPNDALLSTGAGVLYVVPFAGSGTDTSIIPFFEKPALLAGLCKAAFKTKKPSSVVAADYATTAAGIALAYAAAVAQQPTA